MSDRQSRVDQVRWYHDFDFGGGVRGRSQHENADGVRAVWAFIASQLARVPFAGATVLDVGAWDGYWSFLAEQHGARRVLAVDDATQRWADDSGITLARELLGSAIEVREDVSIYDLASLGQRFDVVLCLGVFYHLWDPLYGFAQLRHCCHRDTVVIIEGEVAWRGVAPDAVHYGRSSWQECVLSSTALERLLGLAYLRVDEQVWMHAVPDEATADGPLQIERSLLVCRPFIGRNRAYQYRPHFGLDAYDDRFNAAAGPTPRRAALTPVSIPAAVAAGTEFAVTVGIENTGSDSWRALRLTGPSGPAAIVDGPSASRRALGFDGERGFLDKQIADTTIADDGAVTRYRQFIEAGWLEGGVTLGLQLWDAAGERQIDQDYGRAFLAQDLRPGESAVVTARLRAPSTPGRYLIQADMVCEYVCWFATESGTPLRAALEVTAPPPAA